MKEFKGFNQSQQYKILSKLGYTGPNDQDEMNNFMQSNPAVSAKMGKYAEKAAERLQKIRGYAEGGAVTRPPMGPTETLPEYEARLKQLEQTQSQTQSSSSNNTSGDNGDTPATPPSLDEAQQAYASAVQSGQGVEDAQKALQAAQEAHSVTKTLSPSEATEKATDSPSQLVTPSNVAQLAQNPNQLISAGTGQDTTKETAQTSTVDNTQQAVTPDRTDANTFKATTTADKVKAETDQLEAATGEPSKKATVQGQLESLMEDFEGGATPPWASGAMRNAMTLMKQRGMGASSMAGQAVVQAAMESAISIASQDAQINARFEMQNLNNEQQTDIFKTQQNIASLFTDQAADNAAKQFNAASKNQVDQFFADLESTTSRFNADQVNSIMQFNAGQENAIEQFNKSLQAARDQFNAGNDLVIAQANAKWRQTISLTDTQAQNDANMVAAQTANQFTARALDQIWQKERDIMAFAFQSSENAEDRATEMLLADKSINAQEDAAKKEAIGYIAGKLLFG